MEIGDFNQNAFALPSAAARAGFMALGEVPAALIFAQSAANGGCRRGDFAALDHAHARELARTERLGDPTR
jgi:hypothetical protein